MRYLALSLVFCLSFLTTLAQEETTDDIIKTETTPSPDTASIYFTRAGSRWPGEQNQRLNDTILTQFQYYLPTENSTSLFAINGNAGLAYQSLVFDLPEYTGFRYTPFDFSLYKFTSNNINYFQTTGPYTAVFYSTGVAKEQVFKVTHSQNIATGLTVGVDLNIINSIGLYERQKSDNISFAAVAQWVNKKENYAVLANYHQNKMIWRENGGIANLEMFTEDTEPDRKRIPIRLSNAENLMKENGFFLSQSYYFAKVKPSNPVTDSLKGDTIGTRKIHRYYNPTRSNFIRHTFNYSTNIDRYKHSRQDSTFYLNYPSYNLDTVATFDSVFYREISNDLSVEAGIGRAKGSSKAILLRIGIEHTAGLYRNDTIKNTFNRFTPYGYISANAFGYAKAEGKIWTTQGNPFNGDKGIEGTLTLPGYENSGKWGNLKVNLALTLTQPFYLYQYHFSNYFRWSNSFGQQTTFSIKASYNHRNFKAGFNAFTLDNYIHLDSIAMPRKEQGTVAVTQAWAYTDITVGHFETQLYGVLQTSSNQDVISLPQFAGKGSIFYTVALFKRALHFQTGISLLYNTPYYANAYMPALRAFHVQKEVKTGGYPYLDAFINIRVKRARMFLMMKHLNSGFMEVDYIMTPGYPMPDRGLRFGVSWVFFD